MNESSLLTGSLAVVRAASCAVGAGLVGSSRRGGTAAPFLVHDCDADLELGRLDVGEQAHVSAARDAKPP